MRVIYEAEPVTPDFVYTKKQQKRISDLNVRVFDAVAEHINEGKLMVVEFLDFHDFGDYDTRVVNTKAKGVIALDESDIGRVGVYRFEKDGRSIYDLHGREMSVAKKLQAKPEILISAPRSNTALEINPHWFDDRGLYQGQWERAVLIDRAHIKRISVTDTSF